VHNKEHHKQETVELNSIEKQNDNSTSEEDDNSKSFLSTTTFLPIHYQQ
jgi:hypothetical protein